MSGTHIADAEAEFFVVNILPDFCEVDGCVTPFEIVQYLSAEKSGYAATVIARGEKTLTLGSVMQGVLGNAGKGVISGTAQSGGTCEVVKGHSTVLVEGKRVARHGHLVDMNQT